ncbi:MFS transporter [Neobacillus muris]|uniref:MFS transporter n=1 Tax=Neobacillus muris TaxID=2941334 RepID=UPI002041F090|nr:MFS transporter [Neobacillus muris]
MAMKQPKWEAIKQPWVYTPKKITFFRSLGYGMNDLNGSAWGTLVGSYLMVFLTTYADLNAGIVGTMLFVLKLLDMVICGVIGGVSDHLFSTALGRKLGRRHALFLVGAILTAICFPLLFTIHPGSYLWYFLVLLFLETAQSFDNIAYETLATEMTDKAEERVKLSSVRMFVSAFGTFAVTGLPAILLSALGENNASAYTISGIVFGIALCIGTLITYFSTWEFSPEHVANFEAVNKNKDKKGFLEAVKDYGHVLKTKACRRTCTIYFVSYFAKDCFNTAFFFYVMFLLGLGQSTAQTASSLSILGMIVVPIATIGMYKKGPKFLWTSAFSAQILVLLIYLGLYFSGVHLDAKTAFVVILVLSALWQIGRQTMEYTVWNVIPFVPDVDTLVSTKLRAGTFAACQTFTRKVTGAIGSALIGWVLAFGGFDKTLAEQADPAKWAIMISFAIIPLVCLAYSMYLIRTFNLNQDTHQIIKAEINRLQAGGSKEDVDPKTKAIVEDLTGYNYKDIWNPAN